MSVVTTTVLINGGKDKPSTLKSRELFLAADGTLYYGPLDSDGEDLEESGLPRRISNRYVANNQSLVFDVDSDRVTLGKCKLTSSMYGTEFPSGAKEGDLFFLIPSVSNRI